MTNHHYDNSERLEGVSEQDWREALDELTEHNVLFRVVNNEHNPAIFKRADGSSVTQCECIVYADRNDNKKG